MILSAESEFSVHQAITATADSENVKDLGVPGTPYGAVAPLNQDIGKGTKIPVLFQVTEDFATLTSLTISLATGATTALGTVISSQTIPVADLVAGKQVSLDFLPNDISERYLGAHYTVTGSNATAGKISAGITMGNQTNVTGA